jgi:hypothetical protein
VKSKAGELLGINSSSYIAKVISAHGLEELCKKLVQTRRTGRGNPPTTKHNNTTEGEV